MREKGGRHELKHYINRSDLMELRARLACVMRRDEYTGEGGKYRIRSLYFDNYKDKALSEKINGTDNREKFRLRLYNDNPSFIRLEKKSKKGGRCFKVSAEISASVCKALLAGHPEALLENGGALNLELYAKMRYEQLRPKNIVDYQREAFVFPAGRVRVTLDDELRMSSNPARFLNEDYLSVPLPQVIILEVKYDGFLPELIRGVATLSSRQMTAFSKYAAARVI